MSRPNPEIQDSILKLTITTANRMLTLATTVKIQRQIINRTHQNFRDFESEEAARSHDVLTGTGIIAVRGGIQFKPSLRNDFLLDEVDLGVHEVSAYINAFPLDAAAASYLFTLLEGYGNEVADMVCPGQRENHKAWHHDFPERIEMRDLRGIEAVKKKFAVPFGADGKDVPVHALQAVCDLKQMRNDFAHRDASWISFPDFLRSVLIVLSEVLFLVTGEDRLSVYPWTDYSDEFAPLS